MTKAKQPFNFEMPKLKGIPNLKSPKGWGLPRKGTIKRDVFAKPPSWFGKQYPFGSQPEWAVYRALLSIGLKSGTDFIFKPPQLPFATAVFPESKTVLIIQDGVNPIDKLQQVATLHQAGLKAIYVTSSAILTDPIATTKDVIAGRSPS